MNVPVPLDHFPVNVLTSKVFSFMVKKGKHFSGNVTPLFASMLVQLTEDEGATSERPFEPQPTPSPPHPREANVEPQTDPSPRPLPSTHIPDSIPESSGGNHGGQSSSDKSLSRNEGDMTLQTWMKSLSLKKRLAGKKSKESVSNQGRKSAKAKPSVHKDPLFDELPDDTLDYMDTEDAQDVGRTRDVVNKEKESAEDAVSTEGVVSTDKEKVSTDRPNVILLNMSQAKVVSREKEKGVELKDVEETERPRPTLTRSLLTLKPLPKIDPKKIREKKKIEKEDDLMITELKTALSNEYDFIQARIKAERLLALRLQDEEESSFTVEEKSKVPS
ncbi:hypothetical protein Tco_0669987 [Tanacetum coccineum]